VAPFLNLALTWSKYSADCSDLPERHGIIADLQNTHPTMTVTDEQCCSGSSEVLYCEKDQMLRYTIGESDVLAS